MCTEALFVREDRDFGAEPHHAFEFCDVGVGHADAAFGGAGADGFGEVGAVDADVDEAGDVEAEEPGSVCVADGALAVAEVVREAAGVKDLVDLELPFRCLVVSAAGLGAVVDGAGDAVGLYDLSLGAQYR